MAKARQKVEWDRVSLLAAIVRNSYPLGGKRKKPFQPWEFNPFADGPSPVADEPKTRIKIKVDCLKALCKESGQWPVVSGQKENALPSDH